MITLDNIFKEFNYTNTESKIQSNHTNQKLQNYNPIQMPIIQCMKSYFKLKEVNNNNNHNENEKEQTELFYKQRDIVITNFKQRDIVLNKRTYNYGSLGDDKHYFIYYIMVLKNIQLNNYKIYALNYIIYFIIKSNKISIYQLFILILKLVKNQQISIIY